MRAMDLEWIITDFTNATEEDRRQVGPAIRRRLRYATTHAENTLRFSPVLSAHAAAALLKASDAYAELARNWAAVFPELQPAWDDVERRQLALHETVRRLTS